MSAQQTLRRGSRQHPGAPIRNDLVPSGEALIMRKIVQGSRHCSFLTERQRQVDGAAGSTEKAESELHADRDDTQHLGSSREGGGFGVARGKPGMTRWAIANEQFTHSGRSNDDPELSTGRGARLRETLSSSPPKASMRVSARVT